MPSPCPRGTRLRRAQSPRTHSVNYARQRRSFRARGPSERVMTSVASRGIMLRARPDQAREDSWHASCWPPSPRHYSPSHSRRPAPRTRAGLLARAIDKHEAAATAEQPRLHARNLSSAAPQPGRCRPLPQPLKRRIGRTIRTVDAMRSRLCSPAPVMLGSEGGVPRRLPYSVCKRPPRPPALGNAMKGRCIRAGVVYLATD